jgi:hypothetical protein
LSTNTPTRPPLFIFESSKEASLHNEIVLENYSYNVHKAIIAQENSQVSYSSEFRNPSILEEILEHHPNWLLNRATFPLQYISPKDRKQDLLYHKEQGNHKSTTEHNHILKEIISEDIKRGFALPLPRAILHLIPDALLAPLGCQI